MPDNKESNSSDSQSLHAAASQIVTPKDTKTQFLEKFGALNSHPTRIQAVPTYWDQLPQWNLTSGQRVNILASISAAFFINRDTPDAQAAQKYVADNFHIWRDDALTEIPLWSRPQLANVLMSLATLEIKLDDQFLAACLEHKAQLGGP